MHPYFKKSYRFCPHCSHQLQELDEHLICPVCHFCVYPHPSPSTAIYIFNSKKQLLLARRAIEPKKGYWDSVGGFIKTMESVEEGALREVKEETGLAVSLQVCLGSAPDKYLETPTITIGYLAFLEKGTPKPADDVAELHWLDLQEIPPAKEIAFESVALLLTKAIKLIQTNFDSRQIINH